MKVRNTSPAGLDLTVNGQTFYIPAGQQGEEKNQDGELDFPEELFAKLVEDPVAKSYFDNGTLVAGPDKDEATETTPKGAERK